MNFLLPSLRPLTIGMLLCCLGALTALGAQPQATHSADPYQPGELLELQAMFSHDGPDADLISLLWELDLPEEWSVSSVYGDGDPELDAEDGSSILLTAQNLPNPLVFTIVLNVPASEAGPVTIDAVAEYWLLSDDTPNPLSMPVSPLELLQDPVVDPWPTATDVTYGDSLATSILTNGAAAVAGTFAFADDSLVPDVGAYDAWVIFTPSDPVNFATVSNVVTVSVFTALGTPLTYYEQFNIEPEPGDTWHDVDNYSSDDSGVPNWKQYIAGTDPTDPESLLVITKLIIQIGEPPYIEWIGGTHGPVAPYIIQSRTNLTIPPDWENIGTSPRVDGTNTWGEGQAPLESIRFYRIQATRDEA